MGSSLDERVERRLEEARGRFRQVEERLTDPAVLRDTHQLKVLGQERAELELLEAAARERDGILEELAGAREMLGEDDAALRAMAQDEVVQLEARLPPVVARLRSLLLPRDPLEDRPAVVEVRAGTGGDEAGLFAAELMRMYQRLAERRRWKVELLDLSEGIPGAIREAVFLIRGKGVFGELRSESGVHRVQRVPETESQGRIHTSAATVAVLPEAEEVDVEIDPNDLRIDVFRSSGPGGQSVNTTDSAVRITHVPSGLVVSCQDEKSQLKNKNKAMRVLRSRLLDRKLAQQEAARARERKLQVGTGDRSGKIRTYNFPQNRVTDHRIGVTWHALSDILDGGLDEVISALRLAREQERIEGMGG